MGVLPVRVKEAAGKRCMAKIPRAEAEEVAARVVEALRPLILKTVTDMLAEEDDDGLTPAERAKVDRTVATLARRMR